MNSCLSLGFNDMTIMSPTSLLSSFGKLLLLYSLVFLSASTAAQERAIDVINKSINYHDPDGILSQERLQMDFTETRPNGSDRQSNAIIDIQKEYTKISRVVKEKHIEMIWDKGKSSFKLEGSSTYSPEEAETYALNEERLVKMKDYYRYLWHLPRTLKDPGTIIDPLAKSKEFNNQSALEVRVTYDQNVGSDIWYFYFDTSTYALIGYRFYHDEAANDGEYILLTDEYQYKNLRLPQKRAWYMHQEDKYLGQDILTSCSKL